MEEVLALHFKLELYFPLLEQVVKLELQVLTFRSSDELTPSLSDELTLSLSS